MTFTNVDSGFSARRYSFDGPDFGPSAIVDAPDFEPVARATTCATCGVRSADGFCVACADLEFIDAVSIDRFLNSVDRVEDEPELDEDEEDEEEDDDTESEKAWSSAPGIRF